VIWRVAFASSPKETAPSVDTHALPPLLPFKYAATSPAFLDAIELAPIATAFAADALALLPNTVELLPEAFALSPTAVALSAEAIESRPNAVA
jgi:hypothetical protein